MKLLQWLLLSGFTGLAYEQLLVTAGMFQRSISCRSRVMDNIESGREKNQSVFDIVNEVSKLFYLGSTTFIVLAYCFTNFVFLL